jgi:hypothetical protein
MSGESDTFKSNDIGLEVFAGRQYFTVTGQPFGPPPPGGDVGVITPDAVEALRKIVRPARAASPAPPFAPEAVAARPPAHLKNGGRDEWRRGRVTEALKFISPDDFHVWVRVGMALKKEYGDGGFSMWDSWSVRYPKYSQAECIEKWAKLKDIHTANAGHIFGMAEDNGMPKYTPKSRPPAPLLAVVPSPAPPLVGEGLSSVAQAPRSNEKVNLVPAEAGSDQAAIGEGSPVTLDELLADEAFLLDCKPVPIPDVVPHMAAGGKVSLNWSIAHIRRIYGQGYVWDSVNQQRIADKEFLKMLADKAEFKAWSDSAGTIRPQDLPKLSRGGLAAKTGGEGAAWLFDRFTLLYPTRTAWDHEKRMVVGVVEVGMAFGESDVADWLKSKSKRVVDLVDLVFDPKCEYNPETQINMYEGLPLKPVYNKNLEDLVLDLLWHLVQDESEPTKVLHWLLCWLAYPLQNPGAKMQSAVLMFGETHGTGKSLFWEGIYQPIFGKYGITGDQNQFDNNYSQWLSQKLFVLFEELTAPKEKYETAGPFKKMVTGRTNSITQKFKDDRIEGNYLNVAILSNMDQPIVIEPSDRRMFVIKALRLISKELRASIIDKKGKVLPGIIEAFYHFLLNFDIGDFWPGEIAMMTKSKQEMIEFGLPDWEIFYNLWRDGELSVPYISCLTTDLHEVYVRWAHRGQYRSPLSSTKFSQKVAKRVPKERPFLCIGSITKRQLMTFIVPQDEPKPGEVAQSIEKQVNRFREAADLKLFGV